MGAGILLSRLAGLVRERVIAAHLGTGFAVDAFRAALRIPNLLQNLLGEGVLSASFIPVYARLLAEGEEEEAGRVAGAIAGLLTAASALLVVVGVVFARPLTTVLAGGFTGERFELTVTLVRILTPGIGLLVLSAWCLGVLNSHRRFFLSYVAPVLWNAAQIAVLVAAAARGFDVSSLAVALAWGPWPGPSSSSASRRRRCAPSCARCASRSASADPGCAPWPVASAPPSPAGAWSSSRPTSTCSWPASSPPAPWPLWATPRSSTSSPSASSA